MRHLRQVGFAVFALMSVAVSSASAQRTTTRARSAAPAGQGGFWEIGMDAGMFIGLDDPKSLSIAIPVPMVRAGYFVSDALSLEPSLGFFSAAEKGSTAFSDWTLGFGVLYHLSTDRKVSQLFVHPMLMFNGGSGGRDTRTTLGAGFGMKRPMLGNRLAGRGEVNLNHRLKSGPAAAETTLGATVGLSVYTR